MNPGILAAWATGDARTTVALREQWQGAVYKAILDATLAIPSLYSFSMWGIVDKYSWLALRDPTKWPWTPEYPAPDGNNADLLGGSYDAAKNTWNTVYGFKPAYWDVRDAIVDYFGNAYKVKDSSGNELVRFVENGDVVVFKGPSGILESRTYDQLNGLANSRFAIEDNTGQRVVIVTQDGVLYLHGSVLDNQSTVNAPASGRGLIIRNSLGEIQIVIDDQGALYARGTVVMNGVPFVLERDHGSDPNEPYSIYN